MLSLKLQACNVVASEPVLILECSVNCVRRSAGTINTLVTLIGRLHPARRRGEQTIE
jgi:hypothetical protein